MKLNLQQMMYSMVNNFLLLSTFMMMFIFWIMVRAVDAQAGFTHMLFILLCLSTNLASMIAGMTCKSSICKEVADPKSVGAFSMTLAREYVVAQSNLGLCTIVLLVLAILTI